MVSLVHMHFVAAQRKQFHDFKSRNCQYNISISQPTHTKQPNIQNSMSAYLLKGMKTFEEKCADIKSVGLCVCMRLLFFAFFLSLFLSSLSPHSFSNLLILTTLIVSFLPWIVCNWLPLRQITNRKCHKSCNNPFQFKHNINKTETSFYS